MARSFRVYVTGVKSIDRKLKLLPEKVQKKIIRPAIRDGLKIIKTGMEARVPRDTGLTAKNIKIHAFKKRKVGRIGMLVQVSSKAPGLVKVTKAGKRFFYPAGIEYGSKDHPPDPFGRQTFTQDGPAAKDLTMQKILDGVERESLKG